MKALHMEHSSTAYELSSHKSHADKQRHSKRIHLSGGRKLSTTQAVEPCTIKTCGKNTTLRTFVARSIHLPVLCPVDRHYPFCHTLQIWPLPKRKRRYFITTQHITSTMNRNYRQSTQIRSITRPAPACHSLIFHQYAESNERHLHASSALPLR